LSAEGLLVAQAELTLPTVPQRVWLVGPEGAGLQALIGVLDRSPWRWSVIFVPVATDGADAPWACADAISAAPEEAQVIVLLGSDRPGPSSTSAVFDSEPVARAICSAKAPVISALGHRGDLYLAEECVWAAVTTAREAGDLLCRRMAHTFNQVQVRYHNIARVAEQRVALERQPVDGPTPTVAMRSPEAIGLHRISRAPDAAHRAWRVMIVLAVVSALLIIVALAAALR
jgi:exodeoxyribonuclease VII large subunit